MKNFLKWLMIANGAASLVPTLVKAFEVPGFGAEKKQAVIGSGIAGVNLALVATGHNPLAEGENSLLTAFVSATVDSVVSICNMAGEFGTRDTQTKS